MTFAYYVPSNYTHEAFWAGRLDYAPGGYSINLWGEPTNVVTGIEAHNRVVRDLAAQHPELAFVDMERLIPRQGAYFQDICHFSYDAGSELFARMLAEHVADLRGRRCRTMPAKTGDDG